MSSSSSSPSDQTVNIPQLIIIVLITIFVVRYFFFSGSSSASTHTRSTSAANNIRAREADVERVQQMFPQVSRRSIMWDLQRNGGNVVATTERILSGRGLEVPPQSFQPPLPALPLSPSTASAASQTKPLQPDLITRYNLKAKLAEEATKKRNRGARGGGGDWFEAEARPGLESKQGRKTGTVAETERGDDSCSTKEDGGTSCRKSRTS